MSRRRHPAASATTAAAMSLAELERWLRDRAARRPVATSCRLSTATLPRSWPGRCPISPLDWICPLLAVDADAFNHGGTAEFAAIFRRRAAHNGICNTFSNNPKRFEPIHQRKPNGERRCTSLVPGIPRRHAAAIIGFGRHCSTPATSTTAYCCHPAAPCGRPGASAARTDKKGPQDRRISARRHTDIPAVVEAMRQYWMPIRYARAG